MVLSNRRQSDLNQYPRPAQNGSNSELKKVNTFFSKGQAAQMEIDKLNKRYTKIKQEAGIAGL